MSPPEGDRHNDYKETPIFKHCLKYHLDFYFDETMSLLDNGMSSVKSVIFCMFYDNNLLLYTFETFH